MNATATEVCFRQGASLASDPAAALAEIDQQVDLKGADAVVMFVSSEYDPAALSRELRNRVHAPLLCCSTAGEISSAHGYSTGGIVAATVSGCQAKVFELANVSASETDVDDMVPNAVQWLDDSSPLDNTVGLLVLDGLCRREEMVIDRLQSAVPTHSLVGGSAGDACQFKHTWVYRNGAFEPDSGALLLLRGRFTAIPFQTHHFTPSGIRFVATDVDPANRRLLRLDGVPAVRRLAEIIGCLPEEVTIERLSTRPFMMRCGDSYFVRSAQSVLPDGGLSLFCAVNEGEILHLAKAGDMVDTTGSYFEALQHQNRGPDLVLGFDCILRRMELSVRGRTPEMNQVLRNVPFVGFSTFGEQFQGQHINQSMTGVALWSK